MSMDYEKANQIADRIRNGENSKLYRELASMCTPYLLYIKKKFRFHRIPHQVAKDELVHDAVADSIVPIRKGKPFTLCLQNAFRDCCRDWIKNYRHQKIAELWEEFSFDDFETTGYAGNKKFPLPDIVAAKCEMSKLLHEELMKDEPFSREVVFRRIGGDNYEEIAKDKDSTHRECKNTFWRNLDHLEKRMNHRFGKEVFDKQ